MKVYLFLIFSFFTISAYAENWLNHSKILSGSIEAYSIKETCENVSGEKCYDLGAYPSSVYSEVIVNEIPTIVLDENKVGVYQAEQTAKEARAAKNSSIAHAQALMTCGRRVIAYMLVRNVPKALTTAQVDSLVQTYSPIKALLETGSLVTAKEKILAVDADGILITESDKLALAAEVDYCLQ